MPRVSVLRECVILELCLPGWSSSFRKHFTGLNSFNGERFSWIIKNHNQAVLGFEPWTLGFEPQRFYLVFALLADVNLQKFYLFRDLTGSENVPWNVMWGDIYACVFRTAYCTAVETPYLRCDIHSYLCVSDTYTLKHHSVRGDMLVCFRQRIGQPCVYENCFAGEISFLFLYYVV